MSDIVRSPQVHCECGWTGCGNQLNWIPYNPIDDFYNKDIRDNLENVINFRQACPKCSKEDNLKWEQISYRLDN